MTILNEIANGKEQQEIPVLYIVPNPKMTFEDGSIAFYPVKTQLEKELSFMGIDVREDDILIHVRLESESSEHWACQYPIPIFEYLEKFVDGNFEATSPVACRYIPYRFLKDLNDGDLVEIGHLIMKVDQSECGYTRKGTTFQEALATAIA